MSKFNHLKLSGVIAQSGLTQKEISERLGIHYNTVSGWANGRSPHPDKLYNLLMALGWEAERIEQQPIGEWYELATTAASDTSG